MQWRAGTSATGPENPKNPAALKFMTFVTEPPLSTSSSPSIYLTGESGYTAEHDTDS